MEIEFDPEKNVRNIRDRGISFNQAQEFDWDSALVWSDTRQDHGEERFIALGLIGERLHSLGIHRSWKCGPRYQSEKGKSTRGARL